MMIKFRIRNFYFVKMISVHIQYYSTIHHCLKGAQFCRKSILIQLVVALSNDSIAIGCTLFSQFLVGLLDNQRWGWWVEVEGGKFSEHFGMIFNLSVLYIVIFQRSYVLGTQKSIPYPVCYKPNMLCHDTILFYSTQVTNKQNKYKHVCLQSYCFLP